MSVLSDKWIRKMSKEQGMITPFEEKQVRGNSISYGLSSFGYDARAVSYTHLTLPTKRIV